MKLCSITIKFEGDETISYIFFLTTILVQGFWYMWVYRIWVEDLFVHEDMEEFSYMIELTFFQLGFAQPHKPCNKEWKKTTHTII